MKDRKIREKEERLDPKYERNLYNGLGGTDILERIAREKVIKRQLMNAVALEKMNPFHRTMGKGFVYDAQKDP